MRAHCPRGMAPCTLLALFMLFRLVLFHHSTSGYFCCPVAVAAAFLSRFLDVLVLALFFIAHTAQRLFLWHKMQLLLCSELCPCPSRATRFPQEQRQYNVQIGTRFQWPKRLGFCNLGSTLQDSFRYLAPLFCARFRRANNCTFSLSQRPINHAYQPFSLAWLAPDSFQSLLNLDCVLP